MENKDTTFNWSTCTKSWRWWVMYMCVSGIDAVVAQFVGCNLELFWCCGIFLFYCKIILILIWRPSNESKPVVKIILIYDRLNLWRHRQFITIFYQFLHIRIEIIHGSHIYMYILFLPRVDLYVSFLPLANARDKTS